jgi:transcriptional regulator with XRE-family HTH domain
MILAMNDAASVRLKLAENLRAYRLSAGMTQAELGEKARKDQAVIARMEKAVNSPTLDTVAQVAAALGISSEELLFGEPAEISKISESVA